MLRILCVLAQLIFVYCQEPVINTAYGPIRGRIQQFNGREFSVFQSIPYAAPPVGELRFRPAQRHGAWHNDELLAFDAPPSCPQHPNIVWYPRDFPTEYGQHSEDEDCLYLNIYVSGNITTVEYGSLPVIVFIHGGGFSGGSLRLQIGDVFVTEGEPVVMVTIQYRLGPLGFLSSGDDTLSGNLGLKDQVFALQWLQENIANFGGDPSHVTICGESAGGESVLAHMVSPMSAGLFHKAIAQSPVMAWRYPTRDVAGAYFRRFAESVNCWGDSEAIIQCLQSMSWQEIYSTEAVSFESLMQRVIDGEFIIDEPAKLWRNGRINEAELMVGFNSDDGGFIVDILVPFDFASVRTQDLDILNIYIPYFLSYQLSDDPIQVEYITKYGQRLINYEDLYVIIKARYYDSAPEPVDKGRGIRDYLRDVFFGAFSLFVASQAAANRIGNTYVYMFDHRTASTRQSAPGEVELKAEHAAELAYLFGYGYIHPEEVVMTDEELALTRSIINAWTTFATGEPRYLNMNDQPLDWPGYGTHNKSILIFNTQMSRDSVEDGTTTWQPVLDFWLAIDNLARFEEDNGDRPIPPVATAKLLLPPSSLVLFAIMITSGILGEL